MDCHATPGFTLFLEVGFSLNLELAIEIDCVQQASGTLLDPSQF